MNNKVITRCWGSRRNRSPSAVIQIVLSQGNSSQMNLRLLWEMSALCTSHSPIKLENWRTLHWASGPWINLGELLGSLAAKAVEFFPVCGACALSRWNISLGWGQRHEITLGSSLSFLHHFWRKTDPGIAASPACVLSSQLWAIIRLFWAKPKLKPNHEEREKQEKTPYSFWSTHHLEKSAFQCQPQRWKVLKSLVSVTFFFLS